MSKYTDLEKRLQAIEVEIPKWTGHVSKRIERLEKLVDCLEDCYDAISILDERTKKQEEPKQDEPEIVYGSTVSVRDQKIKKLFDDLDKELSITHDGNANSRTHLFIVLEKYKDKLNKIFGKEI